MRVHLRPIDTIGRGRSKADLYTQKKKQDLPSKILLVRLRVQISNRFIENLKLLAEILAV